MKIDNRKYIILFIFAAIFNIAVRFAIMYMTDHFDFRNFFMTGEIVASGKNIYANMVYYNYGAAFSIVLGLLYRISSLLGGGVMLFKALLVIVLTVTDILIAMLVSKISGKFWGLFFFLNPISMYIAGFQTQFDNIAVMLGAWGVYFIRESSEQERFSLHDMVGVILLSSSLIVKHFMWAFPLFILLNAKINARKKILYAFVPPLIFLLSFVPYWGEGAEGIISHVFMYRSANNFPLFAVGLLKSYGINFLSPGQLGIVIYGILMLTSAIVFRHEDVFHSFLIYTISVVCFTSGLYSQQFVIPCMAIILIYRKWSLAYFVVYLARVGGSELRNTLCVWLLLTYLVYYYFRLREKN